MTERNALGLDLGTKMGFALQTGKRLDTGAWNFTTRPHAAPGQRFADFYAKLDSIQAQTGGLVAVFYETVRFAKFATATRIWGGYEATLLVWCARRRVHVFGIQTATLKQFATGKGNASKEDMIRMFQMLSGRRSTDDNEADAFHVLQWGLQHAKREGLVCQQSK